VYYELSNFYQNHRKFVKSLSFSQLRGEPTTESALHEDCKPLDKVTDSTGVELSLDPCGLIANSMFNDVIRLPNSSAYTLDETNIAWESDVNDKVRERKGKERKGKERKGKERKGKERKGKERKGKERKEGWAKAQNGIQGAKRQVGNGNAAEQQQKLPFRSSLCPSLLAIWPKFVTIANISPTPLRFPCPTVRQPRRLQATAVRVPRRVNWRPCGLHDPLRLNFRMRNEGRGVPR